MITALKPVPGGLEVRLHVQPGASRSEWTGLHGDRLKVRVQAKPVEGAANEAVRRFLAEAAGVSRSQVELLRGATSRDKDLRIVPAAGAAPATLADAMERLLAAAGLAPEPGPAPDPWPNLGHTKRGNLQ